MANDTAYQAGDAWTRHFQQQAMAFPAEYVIRIFKGKYPRLALDPAEFQGRRALDVGCGDGRNMVVLAQAGFQVGGMEITPDLAARARGHLAQMGIDADMRAGKSAALPFEDASAYCVLSWNACYYMGAEREFGRHVQELARVMQPGGLLVLSIPKATNFIYQQAEPAEPGYCVIRQDPFGVRNGEYFRVFADADEITATFSPYFHHFTVGDIAGDCFGLAYHWHLVVCRRKP